MKNSNQAGFGLVVVLIGLLVISAVAFAGYRISTSESEVANSTDSSQSSETTEINSPERIDAAEKSLDAAEADSGADEKQLDEDIDTLL